MQTNAGNVLPEWLLNENEYKKWYSRSKTKQKNVMKCNEIRMKVFAENAKAHDPT